MPDTTTNTAMMKAFVQVQKEVLRAAKDGKNPAFGSRYATLDSVIEAVREPLTTHGFALIQDATTDMQTLTVSVTTRLLHDSGSEMSSPPLSSLLKYEFARDGKQLPPSVQQIGAAITYLRRYSLCPFLGVAFDDDDDGNAASRAGTEPAGKPTATAAERPAPNGSVHRSAHTGEVLDTPEAVSRHKQAAEQTAKQPEKGEQQARRIDPPAGGANVVASSPLVAAMEKAIVTEEMLTGYLRGEFGSPKITKPMLSKGMALDSLGTRIVSALLLPDNWGAVVERIKADPDYLPF